MTTETTTTHQTASTEFVETDSIRYAYRRFGRIYPDAAHASIPQYPLDAARDVNAFPASPTTVTTS